MQSHLKDVQYKYSFSLKGLSFTTDDQVFKSLKQIERNYWNYIDNYNKVNPVDFPFLNFTSFVKKAIKENYQEHLDQADNFIRNYNRYKKSIPTDGIIMYNCSRGQTKLVLVKINGSKVWSMPKGKRERGETSLECACREFHEETGISIEDTVFKTMKCVIVLKTTFYLQESETLINLDDYSTNEISAVKWVDINDVLRTPEFYSKQAFLTSEYLKLGI
jgi:8-oxo-dGTP pyrophosphatase MutT (NUDIX family)